MLASSSNLSYEEIEKIDKLITKVLNIATKRWKSKSAISHLPKRKLNVKDYSFLESEN